jgi:hypothetical protein
MVREYICLVKNKEKVPIYFNWLEMEWSRASVWLLLLLLLELQRAKIKIIT